jgi:glycosyltransferase involved in cell wall biosynthesis
METINNSDKLIDEKISIVVPVFNEEDNIAPFLLRIEAVLEKIDIDSEIIFCLDPSSDDSEKIIMESINKNKKIKLITFSRRFGQPAATMAGILSCTGSKCVVIDVDLQDPPEVIYDMYTKINEGYEVVYAKRRTRSGETLSKTIISKFGYWLINKLSDVNIPESTGDFRIMTRKVIEELRKLSETHGFLRGLVAFVGFRQTFIEYDRETRLYGSGKYNRLIGSLKIGLNGLISFSSNPLSIMSITGALIATLSFVLGIIYLFQRLLIEDFTPGLSTTVILISFFSGIQLLGLGLIGEYIGRIYDEVKQRPMYIIDKKINFE